LCRGSDYMKENYAGFAVSFTSDFLLPWQRWSIRGGDRAASQLIEKRWLGTPGRIRTCDLLLRSPVRLGQFVDFAARLATATTFQARSGHSNGTEMVLAFRPFAAQRNCASLMLPPGREKAESADQRTKQRRGFPEKPWLGSLPNSGNGTADKVVFPGGMLHGPAYVVVAFPDLSIRAKRSRTSSGSVVFFSLQVETRWMAADTFQPSGSSILWRFAEALI